MIDHRHFMYWSIFVYWLCAHYFSSWQLVVISLCLRQLTCKTFHSFYLYVHIDFYYRSSFFIIWFIFQPKASISLRRIIWTFDFFVTFSPWQNLQALPHTLFYVYVCDSYGFLNLTCQSLYHSICINMILYYYIVAT